MSLSMEWTQPWAVIKERGNYIVDLVKSHPWTSLGVATGTALLWSYVRAPKNLPPGPINLPVVGAVSCFGNDLAQKMFDWRKQYGDVVYFKRFGRTHIILNSERSIREAFVKQGDGFGNRDGALLAVIGTADEIFSATYNEEWKKNKKFAASSLRQHGFGTAKSEAKIHDQLNLLEDFLLKSDGSPLCILDELKSLSACIISSIVLGGKPTWDDPDVQMLVKQIDNWYASFSEAVMRFQMWTNIVHPKIADVLTMSYQKQLRTATHEFIDFLVCKINQAALDIKEREAESVVDAYVKERGSSAVAVDIIGSTIMGFFPDAIDTVSILDQWSLLFITYYPEVQRKLHEEIYAVCGSDRIPTVNDRAVMPYTQAVIHETLRITLVLPMSLERVLHNDITLFGYTLPKGAVVSANNFSVHFDPEIFPEPKKFNPSNFLDSDEKFDIASGAKIMTFTVGSRKCLGDAYYKVHLFFLMARVLQRFDLEFDPSAPRPSLEKDTSFLINKPEDFKICFKPR